MMFESKVKMFLVEIGMEGVFSYMSMKNGLNLKHKRTKTLKCYLLILNNTIQPKSQLPCCTGNRTRMLTITTFENAVDELIAENSEAIPLGNLNTDHIKILLLNRRWKFTFPSTYRLANSTPHSETLIDHIHVCNKFLYPKSNT